MSLTPRIDRLDKNYIINGNFDIWQRGTDASGGGSAYVSADRMIVDGLYFFTPAGKNTRLRRDQTSVLSGSLSHGRISTTDGNFNRISIGQKIENVTLVPLIDKTVTLTWFMRRVSGASCNNNANIISSLYTAESANTWGALLRDTLGGSYNNLTHSADYNNLSTSEWTKFTRTFTMTSTMAGNGLMIGIHVNCNTTYVTGDSNTNNYLFSNGDQFDISGISIVEGDHSPDQAIPTNVGLELIKCQRYYEKSYELYTPAGAATSSGTAGIRGINGAPWHIVTFAVWKRINTYTVSYYDWAGNASRIRTNGTNNITLNGVIDAQHGSFALIHNTSVSEIFFHWVANAEL